MSRQRVYNKKPNLLVWLTICSLCVNLLTTSFGIVGFCIIKFNDFSHLENAVKNYFEKTNKSVDKLFDKIDKQDKVILTISDRTAKIEGYIDAVK